MISGLICAFLLAAFLAITAWAWSSRQQARFHEAAQLPLLDEMRNAECGIRNEERCCTPHSELRIPNSGVS